LPSFSTSFSILRGICKIGLKRVMDRSRTSEIGDWPPPGPGQDYRSILQCLAGWRVMWSDCCQVEGNLLPRTARSDFSLETRGSWILGRLSCPATGQSAAGMVVGQGQRANLQDSCVQGLALDIVTDRVFWRVTGPPSPGRSPENSPGLPWVRNPISPLSPVTQGSPATSTLPPVIRGLEPTRTGPLVSRES
jgi:hypothetical protein